MALQLAIVALAAGIAIGRDDGFQQRYIVLAVPFYVGLYFVFELYGRNAWGRVAQPSIVGVAWCLLPENMRIGFETAAGRRSTYTAPLVNGIAQGKPIPLLIGDHSALTWGWRHMLDYLMPELRSRGDGTLRPNPRRTGFIGYPASLGSAGHLETRRWRETCS
ncbi:MAG: hypothetical protein AAF628_31375 [Planctomycetota bacterium]